ncbi:MAG: helix-turn-helix domain-containing protein [Acidimicrobiales bacterium]
MFVKEESSSPSAGLLQFARLKAGLSQAELAERAGVPRTMVSAYERSLRQPTLPTLTRLLKAAGYDLRMHLEPYDDHDDVLQAMEAARPAAERQAWDTYHDERIARAQAALDTFERHKPKRRRPT